MPVTVTETVGTYAGNGSTTIPYPITIQRDRDEDLKLQIDGAESTDFSVSPDGFRTGVAHASTVALVLFRETPRDQIQPFPANTTPAAEDVRAGLDKLTLIAQEIDEALGRAVKAPIGGTFTLSSSLGIDANGNPVSRNQNEEVEFLGIGEKVDAAMNSAAQAETAAQNAQNAANALVGNAYYAPDTFEVYASPI